MAQDFRGLQFNRARRQVKRRPVTIGLGLLAFVLAWNLMPMGSLFWLMLPAVGLLAWMASFGWRQALISLHDLIHHLEQL